MRLSVSSSPPPQKSNLHSWDPIDRWRFQRRAVLSTRPTAVRHTPADTGQQRSQLRRPSADASQVRRQRRGLRRRPMIVRPHNILHCGRHPPTPPTHASAPASLSMSPASHWHTIRRRLVCLLADRERPREVHPRRSAAHRPPCADRREHEAGQHARRAQRGHGAGSQQC